ncbi:MAG: alpha/beta hydrolase [Deltaproteobacteria bacterium]|jgi:alpha-beta hydrolase superfamily lysophospholipase|nr:alpha/beta hydrolase [Deltaproteobacteria bacterium]
MVKLDIDSICKKLEFLSDGFLLQGTLHLPAVKAPPVVIGSHGLLSSSDSPKQIELARRCIAYGIAFFRFDHRGCGESQGDFIKETSLAARSRDLFDAIKLMRASRETGNRIGLFGSSMGGATCLSVAGEVRINSLVTFAAPLRSKSINRSVETHKSMDGPWPALENLDLDYDISDKLAGIHRILIFHGDADTVVPFSDALEIYQKACEPKKLIRQPGGDHLMSHKTHQKQFIR